MSKQISDLNKPNSLPLNVILAGTLVLALPSALGTLLLVAELLNHGQSMERSTTINFLVASIVGFALFFGYIWTAKTQKHNAIFWICSAIYNLFLACVYVFTIASKLNTASKIGEEGASSCNAPL